MYSARSLSLAAPIAAGLGVGTDLLSVLLAIAALVLLLAVGRSVHLRLSTQPRTARHAAPARPAGFTAGLAG